MARFVSKQPLIKYRTHSKEPATQRRTPERIEILTGGAGTESKPQFKHKTRLRQGAGAYARRGGK